MAAFSTSNVRLVGLVSAIPDQLSEVTDDRELSQADLEKVIAATGVSRRPVASGSLCTSDLCFAAASALLKKLQWTAESVDLLVFVSQTPDFLLPATACTLQRRLGLSKKCAAFDVNLGCSGYVYGLSVAGSLVQAGAAKRALVLVGDTISKISSSQDRSVAYLFGDAGSATALEYSESGSTMNWVLGTDGNGADFLKVDAGMFRSPSNEETRLMQVRGEGILRNDEQLHMNGPEVFGFTIREVPSLLAELLELSGWKIDQVDKFIFHQANEYMLKYLIKRMKLPKDKAPISLAETGNTSSASIPMTVSKIGMESQIGLISKWVFCGFGVGFSWGAVTLETNDSFITDLVHVSDEH